MAAPPGLRSTSTPVTSVARVTATPSWVAPAIEHARVARLATTSGDGVVRLVPICFAIVEQRLVSAVDHKPKSTERLHRLDDIAASGVATVLIDHYDDDWSTLWWVRLDGQARVVDHGSLEERAGMDLLAEKYEPYRTRPLAGPLISVEITRWLAWP